MGIGNSKHSSNFIVCRSSLEKEMMRPQSPDVLMVPADKKFDSALDGKVKIVYEEHEDHFPVKKNCKHHKKHLRTSHHKQKSPLKHSKLCLSEFIAPVRLTRRVGLFNHGKKSNTVSRLQFGMSAETKARCNQDLLEILNLANAHTDQETHTYQKRKLTLSKGKNIQTYSGVENDHSSCKCIHSSAEKCSTSSFIGLRAGDYEKHASSSCSESKPLHSAGNSMQSSAGVKLRHSNIKEEIHISCDDHNYINSVMARLHRTLSKKHKDIFPDICLGRKLRKELLLFRSNSKLCKKMCNPNSSSSKYSTSIIPKITASQKVADSAIAQSADKRNQPSLAASFELNLCPELLQKPSRQSQWHFPNSQAANNIFVSSRERALLEEELRIFHSDDTDIKSPVLLSPFSEVRQNSTLTCASPDSDGVPAWKPQSSPFKLPPESPSTPWHYLRRKMY